MSKRYAEHTIADIIRTKPKWFLQKQSDLVKTEGYLKHLLMIMEMGQSHIAEYLFYDVFGEECDYDISSIDMQTLNRLVMEYKPEIKRTVPIPENATAVTRLALIRDLSDAVAPSTTDITSQINTTASMINRYHQDIQGYERSIVQYRETMMQSVRTLNAEKVKLEALELKLETGGESRVDKNKLIVLRDLPKEWMIIYADRDCFRIIRRTPIVMKFLNSATNMCQTLYMGYMGMEFYWDLHPRGCFNVADYINYSSTVIHPHVNGGNICWGNTAARAERLRAAMDVKGYFELFESLLTTYCPDNPYARFDDYARLKTRRWTAFNNATNKIPAAAREIIRKMIAETASDQYLEWYNGYTGTSAALTGMETILSNKRQKLMTYMQSLANKLHADGRRPRLNAILAEKPLNGQELNKLLRSEGIFLPERDAFAKTRFVAHGSINNQMLQLMLCVYGSIPMYCSDGVCVLRPHRDFVRTYKLKFMGTMDFEYLVVGEDIEGEKGITNMRYAGVVNVIAPTVPVQEVKPLDAAIATFREAFQGTVSSTTPFDESDDEFDPENCDHEYDNSGHCSHCGAFNEDYIEAEEEEEESAEVPF